MKKTVQILIIFLLTALVSTMLTVSVFAYFSATGNKSVKTEILVNNLFGILKDKPSAGWGESWDNPYLIYDQEHLKNLYLLQNVRSANTGIKAFDENTYFQVSTDEGAPCAVGDMSIPSIGSEDFPFISNLRGIYNANQSVTVGFGGINSNTSAIYGVTVTGFEGQIDIGLFGIIGNSNNVASAANVKGSISNILLYDVSIETNSVGGEKENHSRYLCTNPHETNHIGILAGHAQGCLIENVSVYYSEDGDGNYNAAAFNIAADDTAEYVSSSGIIGFYENIFLKDSAEPVSTESNSELGGGGSEVGIGTGMMFADDLWNSLASTSANSYVLNTAVWQSGKSPYSGTERRYFRQGVFTFVHSTQSESSDVVTRLWTNSGDSDQLTIADGYTFNDQSWNYYSYAASRVTRYQNSDLGSDIGMPATSTTGSNQYYYMLVATTSWGAKYALTRAGATKFEAKEVEFSQDGTRIIIPGDISGTNSTFDYYFASRTNVATATFNSISHNYGDMRYGDKYVTMSAVSGNWLTLTTAPQSNNTSSISFVEAGTTNTFYAASYYTRNTSSNNYKKYVNFYENELLFDATSDHRVDANNTAVQYTNSSRPAGLYTFEVYRVNKATENTITDRTLSLATPTASNTESYDMHTNVLFYDIYGAENVADPTNYYYDLVELKDLKWVNSDKEVIERIDTALIMADNINYTRQTYTYGFITGVPVGNRNFDTPQGSIAFQVTGTGLQGDMVNINLIVATNPTQLINQTFACYNITNITASPWGSSTSGLYASFKLPPVPQVSTGSFPIYVREPLVKAGYDANGKKIPDAYDEKTGDRLMNTDFRTAYTNFNTVLVATQIQVPCTNDSFYVLGADKGAATFVYFSVERAAADRSRNPDHDNSLFFSPLNGIDYVYTTSNRIDVVGSSNYVQSLIVPYVGLLNSEPLDPEDGVPVTSGVYSVKYYIKRRYNSTAGYAEIHIHADGSTLDGIDYTECSGYTPEKTWAYSDKVIITLSGSGPP